MAADDDKNEASDPWADLVADDLGSEGDDVSFSFVEKAPPEVPVDSLMADEAASAPPAFVESEVEAGAAFDFEPHVDSDQPAGEQSGTAEMAGAVSDEDAEVGAWLSASDGEAADAVENEVSADQPEPAPPLSVFAPEEAATEHASQSSIEIGTGFSGIDMSADGADSNAVTAAEELDGWDGLEATDGEADPFAASFDTAETSGDATASSTEDGDGEESTLSFEAAAPVAAAAAAVTAPRKTVAKPRAKGGGLGPMIGVVAGGVMAIPITMAILLWGFQKDPFGVAKQVPESMSFLLPQKFRPGFKRQAGGLSDLAAAPSLDDLAAAEPGAEPAVDPGAEPAPLDAAVAALDPLAAPLTPPGDDAAKPESPNPEPENPLFPDPDAPAAATPDPLAAATPAPPVVSAEPAAPALPPLDMAALEAAVAEATTALEAAAAVENHGEIAGKKLLVGWYKSLARTADELVKLQNEAADSGRPVDGVPEQVAAVYEGIAAEKQVAAALPLLARDWLAYARRDSEGILLPVTFDSAKKAGPYWRSKVMLEDGDQARELVIISREEPAAVAGEKLLVTGVVFDGDVIWAAEVRAMPAEPLAVDF